MGTKVCHQWQEFIQVYLMVKLKSWYAKNERERERERERIKELKTFWMSCVVEVFDAVYYVF